MAKACRVAIRGVDEHGGGAAIPLACMIDEEFIILNVPGERLSIPEQKSTAGQGQGTRGINEMTFEELESAILEIETKENPS